MLLEILDLFSYHSRFSERFAEHDHNNVFQKVKRDLTKYEFGELKRKRVLDLGCGQRYPFSLQCAAAGAEVIALDTEYIKPDILPIAFYRTVKYSDLKRALKSAIRRLFFDRRYYRALEAIAGGTFNASRSLIEFIVADPTGTNYNLPDESFDLIVSNAVLEHVVDVPLFAREIERLLVSGGFFYSIAHNFYSLSGGHNMDWAFPDEFPSSKVPPWDHLRENKYPVSVYLNRHKPEDYQNAFSEHLEVVIFESRDINHDPGGWEGESFLTRELATELAEYPKELLLTRGWCIICRKS